MSITLKDETSLTGATTKYGSPVPVYDDCYGTLWVFSTDPYGSVALLIRAQSWYDAWDIAIDESSTIAPEEVPEAYGYETQAELDAAVQAAQDGTGAWPELGEGYAYQGNCTGTGIVDIGDYANLNPWHRDCGVTPIIERDD